MIIYLSEQVAQNIGLRQGDNLSPNLFKFILKNLNSVMFCLENVSFITETSPYSFRNFRELSLYNCFMPI